MPILDRGEMGYKEWKRLYRSPVSMLVSAGAVTTLSIPGLRGLGKEFFIRGVVYLNQDSGVDTVMFLRLNNDSTAANYGNLEYSHIVSGGGASTSGSLLALNTGLQIARTHNTAPANVHIRSHLFTSPSNGLHAHKGRAQTMKDTSNWLNANYAGWHNSTAEITQIDIIGTKTFYGQLELYEKVSSGGGSY